MIKVSSTAHSESARADFIARFGGVFEHSAWIAERAFDLDNTTMETASGLHAAMAQVFRSAGAEERLGVLNAHPDLAGKLAQAKRLTAESGLEQSSAGLDALTDQERSTFENLNDEYKTRFGFPFIIAVKGLDKAQILEAFQRRIGNDRDTEFATACEQVEKIAMIRLNELLPPGTHEDKTDG